MLRQHVAQDAVRHAYLFAGAPGLGRRTLALRFAQALNCTQPLQPGVPCRECRDCKQIEAMQHADLTVIQADSEGGTLKVDQVREARRSLTALKPYQSKYYAWRSTSVSRRPTTMRPMPCSRPSKRRHLMRS